MALRQPSTMTVEEYFALEERDPETRYEYIDGYVYAMAGGSIDHGTIGGNIYAILKSLLRGTPCRVFNSDLRVRVSETCYFLPDVTVSCNPANRGKQQFLEDPRVVFEVLSPSTEARDRGLKLKYYLACPTIEEYVLVDPNTYRIEIYRKKKKSWDYTVFEAGEEIEILCLGVHFPIEEAYEDVDFAGEARSQL
ncbi:MAG TPA: Uma2 family endonuclease [Ktedonobacteraceae bacterium]|nr:Uma2 family endonuclease [Ktedonobacteraceae bacterium]